MFQQIKEAGLTINPAKCSLAKRETEYLGYVLGNGVIKPQIQKIQAIQSCPLPSTKKQVRSFLGLAGWYRMFIPLFATRAALTRKSSPNQIQWTEQTRLAFQNVRDALVTNPVLYSPDFEKIFVLQTDASEVGLGAVLKQEQGGELYPVAYLSRKLYPRETRYSVNEKECLTLKWALDSFKYYLLGRDFVVETDHRALQWINKMKDTNACVTRWSLSMQPFHFIVRHRPGSENVTADFLSRLPCKSLVEGEDVTMS